MQTIRIRLDNSSMVHDLDPAICYGFDLPELYLVECIVRTNKWSFTMDLPVGFIDGNICLFLTHVSRIMCSSVPTDQIHGSSEESACAISWNTHNKLTSSQQP